MADLHVQYVLTTPGPDITFNSGTLGDGTDKYWISAIQGLDQAALRVPVDPVPFGNGGIIHTTRKGPRQIIVDGSVWVEAFTNQTDCQERRNDLVFNLMSALDSILSPTTGTLAWTPTGQSAKTLTVFSGIAPLDIRYTDNYAQSTFSFGLISESADPS